MSQQNSMGQKIGYRYASGKEDIFLCSACNFYKADYEKYQRLGFHSELWSIDQWAQRQRCERCQLSLWDSYQRERTLAVEEVPARGRPTTGRTKENATFSLDKDILTMLRQMPAGEQSRFVNTTLREKMESRPNNTP